MAVRNVCRQMRQHALPAAADAGFCLKFFPSASRPDKRGSRYAALTAAAAAAWLSLYPWAEAQADDAPSYTEIDQYHGEFTAKDGTTFSYLPDAGKFEGPGDKPVTPTGTDAPHNYLIELNGTHLTAIGTDNSGLSPSELRILNSDEGTVSTNKLTYYTGSSAYASAGAAGGGSITFVRSRLEADNNIFDFTGTELSASGSAQSVPDGHEPIFSSLTFTDSLQGASDSNTVTMNNGSTQNSSVTLTGGASAVFVSGAAGAASNTITLNGTALSAEGASKDGRVYGDITLISSSEGSVSDSTLEVNTDSNGKRTTMTASDGASIHFINGANGVEKYTIGLDGADISAAGAQAGGSVYGDITLVESSHGIVSGSGSKITLSRDGSGNRTSLAATDGASVYFVNGAEGAEGNTIELNGADISAKGVQADGRVYGGAITLIGSSDGTVSGSTVNLHSDGSGAGTTLKATDGASIHLVSGAKGAEGNAIEINGAAITADGDQADGVTYGSSSLIESLSGTATDNEVYLHSTGSSITSFQIQDGADMKLVSGAGGVSGNHVRMSGAILGVTGGGTLSAVSSSGGTAEGNTVEVLTAEQYWKTGQNRNKRTPSTSWERILR